MPAIVFLSLLFSTCACKMRKPSTIDKPALTMIKRLCTNNIFKTNGIRVRWSVTQTFNLSVTETFVFPVAGAGVGSDAAMLLGEYLNLVEAIIILLSRAIFR